MQVISLRMEIIKHADSHPDTCTQVDLTYSLKAHSTNIIRVATLFNAADMIL